jgi:hypothetical protein
VSHPHVVARYAVAVTAVCAVAGLGGVPASAVQTATFGLAATGARTKIVHPAQSSPIRDSVLIYNRTASPITVTLDVVGVTQQPGGSYSLGASGRGLAARVRLETRSARLAAKARRVVGVTIDSPKDLHAPAYAAITAVAGPGTSGGVAVTERLAVLVGVTPSRGDVSATAHTSGSSSARTVAVVVATVLLLALVAILVTGFTLRRRRRPAADGAP